MVDRDFEKEDYDRKAAGWTLIERLDFLMALRDKGDDVVIPESLLQDIDQLEFPDDSEGD